MRMSKTGWIAAGFALTTGGAAQAIPMSGLQLWLKADAGVTTSGGDVSQWLDQSGGTVYALEQSDVNRRPTLVSDWGYQSMPALEFDGFDDFLLDATQTLDVTSGWTVFIVGQNNIRRNYNGLFKLTQPGSPESANSRLEFYWQAGDVDAGSGNIISAVNRDGLGAFDALQGDDNPPPVGLPYIFDSRSGSGSQHRTNGVVADTKATNLLPASSNANPLVGFGYANYSLDGHIAEVLVYDRYVTTEERDEIYAYLSDRYIPEPASLAMLACGGLLTLRRRARD